MRGSEQLRERIRRSRMINCLWSHSLTQAGISPHADFGVWRPFGQRAAKSLKFVSHFLDNTGSWRCKEIPGPDSIVTWEACWRVFRTAAIMCDLVAPAVLDRYSAAFRARVERFQDSWHLCVLADTRCRAEHWEAEQRRQALFHDSNPELSAFQNDHGTVLSENLPKIGISGRRNWKTRLQIIAMSADWFTKRLHQVHTQGTDGTDPGHRRASRRSNEDVMGEATHCVGVTAGIAPHLRENKSVSSTIATWVVVRMIARPSEHTCVSSVWNRIAQWSVLVTRGGRLPKVRVRGTTRASGEFVWCDPGQGAK